MTSSRRLTWLAVAAAACAGCGGPPPASLSGVVTLDGKPLQGLQVTLFESSGGQLHTTGLVGTTDAAGRYSFPRVHAGTYRGTFERISLDPKVPMVTSGAYDDRDMTVIEFTVAPGGGQVHDFPLRSPAAAARAAIPPPPPGKELPPDSFEYSYRTQGDDYVLALTNRHQGDLSNGYVTLAWMQDGTTPQQATINLASWKAGEVQEISIPRSQNPRGLKLQFRFNAQNPLRPGQPGMFLGGFPLTDPPR